MKRLSRRSFVAIDKRDMTERMPPTALEMAVLLEHCKQLPAHDFAALKEQIENIAVSKRENTGAGFYTHFILGQKPKCKINSDVTNCLVAAKIDDVNDALGFILWLKDGFVDYLEGYTQADVTTEGRDLTALKFEVRGAPPWPDGWVDRP